MAIISLGIVACGMSPPTPTGVQTPALTPGSSQITESSEVRATLRSVSPVRQPATTPTLSTLGTAGPMIVPLTPTPTRPARPTPTTVPATSTPTPHHGAVADAYPDSHPNPPDTHSCPYSNRHTRACAYANPHLRSYPHPEY